MDFDLVEFFHIVFSISVFFHGHWRLTGQQGKGGDHLLFHSTASTRSRTLRHIFVTLHVRWISHVFNRNACIYQTATRWDLPPYRITIWLTDDLMLIFVCLLDDCFSFFLCNKNLKRETCGPELASTITLVLPTNQVRRSPQILGRVLSICWFVIEFFIIFLNNHI